MGLAQNAYIEASNVYETSLEENYKKNNGIFYTDVSLAEKMISELKIPKSSIILDPCCGAGVFLYAAKKRGYDSVFGADQDADAIKFCIENTQGGTFATIDTLGKKPKDILEKLGLQQKPNYIIGNPPYAPITGDTKLDSDYLFTRKVADTGNNLFIAAIMRALEIVADNGIISYIIPKNFLHVSSYSNLRKELLSDKTILSIIDIGAYFKNVRGEQIIITIKNCICDEKHKISLKRFSNNRFVNMVKIPQKFYKDEILLFTCSEDFSTYKKLTKSYQHLGDLRNGYVGRGKSASPDAISGKDIRKFGYKNREIPTEGNIIFLQNIYSAEAGVIATFGGNLEASQTVTIFTDGDKKMCRYILGILHSKLINLYLIKYCYNHSKLTMHTDAKYLKKIPLPNNELQTKYFDTILRLVNDLETIEYMSQNWFNKLEELNQIVYRAYNISDKEENFINTEIKKIQSKRWYINE